MKFTKIVTSGAVAVSAVFGGSALTTTGTLIGATALNFAAVSTAEAGCDWACRQARKEKRKQDKEDRKLERLEDKARKAGQKRDDAYGAAMDRQAPRGGSTAPIVQQPVGTGS